MRAFCLSVVVCVIVVGMPPRGRAQEPIKARTYSGQRVLLYADGTWKPDAEATARGNVPAAGELGTTTLLSRSKYHDYEKATFSFVHGIRDDPGLEKTRNDWDLLFGNWPDAFDVTITSDDRSRIKDLGKLAWSGLGEIGALPAYLEPTREKPMPAQVGHIYEVHIKDEDSDLYALFRVEWLEPGDSCVLSWVVVPSPEGE
jgi:hypothetical protein